MARTKDRSETEYLRGLVKSQKSEIRNLKKELARSGKQLRQVERVLEEAVEEDERVLEVEYAGDTSKALPSCEECSRVHGKTVLLEVTDLGIKWLHQCKSCGKRKTVKK